MSQAAFFFGTLPMPAVADDARRTIYEINLPRCSVQGFDIKSNVGPLGNHFHQKKWEQFHILEGGGTLYTQTVDKDNNATGPLEQKQVMANGECHIINAFTAHAFVLEPGTKMLCYSSEPFNPDDKDMHPFKVA